MSLVGQELRRTSPKSYRYPALFTLPAPSGAEAESRGAEAKGAPSKGRRSLRCESFHHLVYIATPAPPPPESAAPFVAISRHPTVGVLQARLAPPSPPSSADNLALLTRQGVQSPRARRAIHRRLAHTDYRRPPHAGLVWEEQVVEGGDGIPVVPPAGDNEAPSLRRPLGWQRGRNLHRTAPALRIGEGHSA